MARSVGVVFAALGAMACAPGDSPSGSGAVGSFELDRGQSVFAEVAPTFPVQQGKRTDRVLVDPVSDEALAALCAEHGVDLLRAPGRSGVAAIGVPDGLTAAAFTEVLVHDARVDCVLEESWFTGASSSSLAVSWHLDAVGASGEADPALADVVVAVVDSGVAWEREGGWGRVTAGSLADNPLASPWDFVEDDAHPADAHQHGTHIASVIGSSGDVNGVAPGVGLMPLRVLDAHNQGSELDLVEAILWATDRGADVVNLSVSFWPGYQPSEPLLHAIETAADAGVLLVASAGNDAWDGVTWPAASPRVLAVGSVCPTAGGGLARADYANHGVEVDLVAPGGCLDRDGNGDGVVDGVAGETIHRGDEGSGIYLWSGTSQAAAVVSGAAARLVARGLTPEVAGAVLVQHATTDPLDTGATQEAAWWSGLGTGLVHLPTDLPSDTAAPGRHLASVLPYLSAAGSEATPQAQVSVVDADGRPVAGADVLVRADGSSGSSTHACTTDDGGGCRVGWPDLSVPDDASAEHQWSITVVGLVDAGGQLQRPGAWVMAAGGLELVLDAADASGALEDTLLAWEWSAGSDPVFGELAAAWAFVDFSAGVTRAPGAVLATPGAVSNHGEPADGHLDLDGSGLATSPMGLLPWAQVSLLSVGGSGLATSPMGLVPVDVVGIRAVDLLSAAGVHPADVHTIEGSGLATSPFGYSEGPVDLATATELGWAGGSGVLVDHLARGGLRSTLGHGAQEALVSVGLAMERGWQGVDASSPSVPVAAGGAP